MLCAKLQAINSKINLTSGCRNLPPPRKAPYEPRTNLTSFQYAPFLFVSPLSLSPLISLYLILFALPRTDAGASLSPLNGHQQLSLLLLSLLLHLAWSWTSHNTTSRRSDRYNITHQRNSSWTGNVEVATRWLADPVDVNLAVAITARGRNKSYEIIRVYSKSRLVKIPTNCNI